MFSSLAETLTPVETMVATDSLLQEARKKNKNAERWRKWHENNKAEYNAKRRKAARIKAAEKRLAATRPNHRAVSAQPKVKRVKTLHESPLCPLLLPLPLPPVPSSIIIPNSSSLGAGLLKLYSSPCFAMGAMRMMAPPPPVAMMAMAAMTPTGMMPFTTAAMPFVDFNRY